jgi:hypothetical protein
MGNSQSTAASSPAASGSSTAIMHSNARQSTATKRDVWGARHPYDVFLSHGGEQKAGFVANLNKVVENVGARLQVFMDKKSLEVGDHGWEEVKAAAKNTHIGKC